MTTPRTHDYGETLSSPFLGVPTTPAVYQRLNCFSESPMATVPQLRTHSNSPDFAGGIIQRVPNTPVIVTPATTRTSQNLFNILHSAKATPRRRLTDNHTGSQVVPSGFSPFLQSQKELVELSPGPFQGDDVYENAPLHTDNSSTIATCDNNIGIIHHHNRHEAQTTDCKCQLQPLDTRAHRVRFTPHTQIKQLNLLGEDEDIFEQ